MTKRVSIRYFAVLREQRGLGEERLDTEAATAAELYGELRGRFGFTLSIDRLRVAINDSFEPWDAAVKDADSVAFIPPVAGG
jgi:molybdopterin converting factor subunit 1